MGGNSLPVRAAAASVLGATAVNDARAFQVVSDTLLQAVEANSFPLATAAAEALVRFSDKRGLQVLQQAREKTPNANLRTALNAYEQRLQQQPSSAAAHP